MNEPTQPYLPGFERVEQTIRPNNDQVLKAIRSYQDMLRILKRDRARKQEQAGNNDDTLVSELDTEDTVNIMSEIEHIEKEIARLYTLIRPEEG